MASLVSACHVYQSHDRNKATSKRVEEATDEVKEAAIEQSQAQQASRSEALRCKDKRIKLEQEE